MMIQSFRNYITAFFFPKTGIMACGDEFAVQHFGTFVKCLPLDMGVAQYTGIGGPSGEVFIHKIVNHRIAKLIANIEDIMMKSMFNSDGTGIVDRIQTAAAGFFATAP